MIYQRNQLLLSTLLLVTGGLMLYGMFSPQPKPTNTPAQHETQLASDVKGAKTEKEQVEEVDFIPLSDFTETTARPLFSASRRPPPSANQESAKEPVEEAVVQTVERNQFAVMGIVSAQDEKVALLKKLNSNEEVVRVKEGQAIFGWTVTEIAARSVTLQQNGVTDLIKLSDNTLSEAEKQQLLAQARQEQIKAATNQKVITRRSNIINDRRKMIESARRIRATPKTQK